MANEIFRFRQFAVRQNNSVHKVGTDGVLLGAWTECRQAKTILDFGTGTGLLALMMAQKNPEAEITAVDIEESAVILAAENFRNSPWSRRMVALASGNGEMWSSKKFDLIISNPPYFEKSLLSPRRQRNTSRHGREDFLEALFSCAAPTMRAGGKLSVIIPETSEKHFLERAAALGNWQPENICRVRTIPGSKPSRSMLLLSRRGSGCEQSEITILDESRQRSGDLTALTSEFYI